MREPGFDSPQEYQNNSFKTLGVAQLVESSLWKRVVAGSSPAAQTKYNSAEPEQGAMGLTVNQWLVGFDSQMRSQFRWASDIVGEMYQTVNLTPLAE